MLGVFDGDVPPGSLTEPTWWNYFLGTIQSQGHARDFGVLSFLFFFFFHTHYSCGPGVGYDEPEPNGHPDCNATKYSFLRPSESGRRGVEVTETELTWRRNQRGTEHIVKETEDRT